MIDSDRERTKIVQRGDFDLSGLHRFKNAGQKANADTMAQFSVLKTQIANFPQHRTATGVTIRIPARRERIHKNKKELSAFSGFDFGQSSTTSFRKLEMAWSQPAIAQSGLNFVVRS